MSFEVTDTVSRELALQMERVCEAFQGSENLPIFHSEIIV